MTLLEKAHCELQPRRQDYRVVTDEHIELAIAWAKGKITYAQACRACGFTEGGGPKGYIILARSLREAFAKGILK